VDPSPVGAVAEPPPLLSDTCGRRWDWVTPRSASRNAAGFEIIDRPRAERRPSWPRLIRCGVVQACSRRTLCRGCGFTGREHPADGLSAVDVHDQGQPRCPFRGAVQLRDVPRRHLIRCRRDRPGLHCRRVSRLPAPFPGLSSGAEQPIERGLRPQVDALVEQDRPPPGRARSADRFDCNTSRTLRRSASVSARG